LCGRTCPTWFEGRHAREAIRTTRDFSLRAIITAGPSSSQPDSPSRSCRKATCATRHHSGVAPGPEGGLRWPGDPVPSTGSHRDRRPSHPSPATAGAPRPRLDKPASRSRTFSRIQPSKPASWAVAGRCRATRTLARRPAGPPGGSAVSPRSLLTHLRARGARLRQPRDLFLRQNVEASQKSREPTFRNSDLLRNLELTAAGAKNAHLPRDPHRCPLLALRKLFASTTLT